METKPKIDFSKDDAALLLSLENRLTDCDDFHRANEVVVCSIMEMMLEKTAMYGGNNNNIPFRERMLRAYYEGIGRKANRLPKIMERIIDDESDVSAKRELVDTIIDIAGYSILALSAVGKEAQGE